MRLRKPCSGFSGNIHSHTHLPCPVTPVCCDVCVHRYQGHVSAALVLGGVDVNGPKLYSIYPHGSTDTLPFVTMGVYWFASEYCDAYTATLTLTLHCPLLSLPRCAF